MPRSRFTCCLYVADQIVRIEKHVLSVWVRRNTEALAKQWDTEAVAKQSDYYADKRS